MTQNLPKHIIEKLERRWASRLSGEAAAWRAEKPAPRVHREIADRKGRSIPVAFARATAKDCSLTQRMA